MMFRDFEWGMLILAVLIFSLGLAVLASVSPEFVKPQLIYFSVGLVLFFIFSRLDYQVFQGLAALAYFFCLLLLLSTLVLGHLTRGTLRWLSFGPFTLQPTEIIKPFFILAFSGFGVSLDMKRLKSLGLMVLFFLPLALLIFYQPALGSLIVVSFSWLAIIFASGANVWHLLAALLAGSVTFPLFWRFLAAYQKERILVFLNPASDPLGSGYHLIQAKIAIGSGRIFGKGLGQGTQSHLRFLPEFQSDFIFAALAEELGLIGSLMLFAFFILLIFYLLRLSQRSQDRFGSLVALGIASLLGFQVFVNIAMNLGLLPITGITLPLVSSGGSSLIATLIALGISHSIARVEKKQF